MRVGCDNQCILKVAKFLIEVYLCCNLLNETIPPSQYPARYVKLQESVIATTSSAVLANYNYKYPFTMAF